MRCWLPCSGPVWSCFSRFCMVGISGKLQTPPAIVPTIKTLSDVPQISAKPFRIDTAILPS